MPTGFDARLLDATRVGIAIVSVIISLAASRPVSGNDGIRLSIHEATIQSFCDAMFPLQLKGKKRVGVTVLGRTVSQEMPWVARVSSPSVTIARDGRRFVAHVEAESAGLIWKGEVEGTMEARYDRKRQAIVISVADAVVPVTLGPLQIGIDVAKEVPELSLVFPLPEISLPEGGKRVRVLAEPEIEFGDAAVVVTGNVAFEPVEVK